MSYKALAVRLNQFEKHPNADKLKIAHVNGFTIIVGADTKEGTEGLFFSTDTPGAISEWFLTEHNLYRNIDPITQKNTGGMFEKNGRVKSVKLRGIRSDGFFFEMPGLKIGEAYDTLNGKPLCYKYYNQATLNAMKTQRQNGPKYISVNLPEHFETENLRMMIKFIPAGSTIIFTEKYHGTSGRTGRVESGTKWYHKLFGRKIYNYVTGSRRMIVADEGVGLIKKDDYHGDSSYRLYWHDAIKSRGLHKDEIIFYEIIGYTPNGKPIMTPHDNNGEEVVYHYGNQVGSNSIRVYRISYLHDSVMIDLTYDEMCKRCVELGLMPVPELGRIIYDGDIDKLVKLCVSFGDKPSTEGNHICEGVVLNVSHKDYRNKPFVKQKSEMFCQLEGIAAASDWYTDIEDAQS